MRKMVLFFLCVLICLAFIGSAAAAPEDVSIFPLTRYNYKNIDGYGFYDKCGDTSWFGLVLQNEGSQSVTVTFPESARVSNRNGTVHTLTNFRFRPFDTSKKNFLGFSREGTAFQRTMILPANSVYAVFMDVKDISRYNLYWDTDIFFTIQIKLGSQSLDLGISGVLAQRGNACPADQVCSASVISGSYASDGSGEVIVTVRNNMPDSANVTAQPKINLSWVDSAGVHHTQTLTKGITWKTQPGYMASGSEKTISGTLSLPVEVAAAADSLNVTFHFYHPSSLFFGNFETTAGLSVLNGLRGTLAGSFEADASGGSFSAVLSNHQDHTTSVTLPTEGKLTSADGKTTDVELAWSVNSPVNIASRKQLSLTGTFRFKDTSQVHSNSSLILSAVISGDGESSTAAGTVTRNADKDPTITAAGFCRNYTAGSQKLSFVYVLRNDAHIDIPVQLAGTLAVDEQPRNLTIHYTDCESSGSSCFARINGTGFTIEAGETAAFYGEVTLETIPSTADIAIRTSLLYSPDGETKALFVGQAEASCAAEPTAPVATATAVPTSIPTDIPTEVPTEMPTAVPTATAATVTEPDPQQDPTLPPTATTVPTATAIPTEVPTAAPTATAIPTAIPTEIPQPVIVPQKPELNLELTGGNYTRCGDDPSLHFTMTIVNNGTAEGELKLPDLSFRLNGETITAEFSSCVQMSAAGNDSERCSTQLAGGTMMILPGITLRLEGLYQPGSAIDAESVELSFRAASLKQEGSLQIKAGGSACKPLVETVPDNDGLDILSSISADGNMVTLSIRLINSGSAPADVMPGTIYLHNAVLDSYEGTVMINPINAPIAGKDIFTFSKGAAFSLPPQSTADLSLDLNIDPAAIRVRSAAVNWNFSIANERRNFRGSVSFPQQESQGPRRVVTGGNDAIRFFAVGDPQIPDMLPATGFPTHGGNIVRSIQPDHLRYESLDGLHLEIPVISASMDILRIPLDDNREWAVEWLTDEAGILTNAPLPGEGTSLIAAHNHLDEMNVGPFYRLYELEEKDRIFVTNEDGAFLMYSVYANLLVRPAESDSIYRIAIPGSLVLMTCESELPEGGYAYRRLIFAEPLQ